MSDENSRPACDGAADQILATSHSVTDDRAVNETCYTARDLARWYELGVQHERQRAAGADREHAAVWARLGEQVSQDRRQQLLRLLEQKAHEFHERELGRAYVPFTGVAG